jgi:beta-lactamase superfamily II metal-dependent hydrolase
MYRQGLGDCFLLAFPTDSRERPHYVLIDCGVHAREDKGPARLLRVMQHLKQATNAHLDLVVATHEHADHLSGFVQKQSPFLHDDLTVDALWIAWTEKVGDTQADELRKKRGAARELIDQALEECRRRAGLGAQQLSERIAGMNDFEQAHEGSIDADGVQDVLARLAAGSAELRHYRARGVAPLAAAHSAEPEKPSSNELALALLKAKAGDNVVYCEPGQVLSLGGVANARAYVLGPPRTPELLKKDLPTKVRGAEEDGHPVFKEVYLSSSTSSLALALSPALGLEATVAGGLLPGDWRYPFQAGERRRFTISDEGDFQWDRDQKAVSQHTARLVAEEYLGAEASWRRIDSDWLGAVSQVALNLDSDTNNTSLVLAFELGPPGLGQVLLFPGDAQVGNWLSWRDQKYKSADRTMTADELLSRTLLYKVGHHGSHNATVRRDPREHTEDDAFGVPYGLELMNDIIAMVPVDWAAAQKKMPDPWRMPHEPLYRRLREKARRRVLRSDVELKPLDPAQEEADLTPTSTEWEPVPGLKGLQWRRSQATFAEQEGTQGPLCYDVAIPLRAADE